MALFNVSGTGTENESSAVTGSLQPAQVSGAGQEDASSTASPVLLASVSGTGQEDASSSVTGNLRPAAASGVGAVLAVGRPLLLPPPYATLTPAPQSEGGFPSVPAPVIAPVLQFPAAHLSTTDGGPFGTISLTVPAGGIAAGQLALVWVGLNGAGVPSSVTDTRGNTYTVLVTVSNASGRRLALAASVLATALLAGDLVTAHFPNASSVAMGGAVFSGIASSAALGSASATGNSTSPSSGALVLGAAPALLLGAHAINEDAPTVTFTPGSGWTALTPASTPNDSPDTAVFPCYRVAAAAGTFTGDGTLSGAQQWASALAALQ